MRRNEMLQLTSFLAELTHDPLGFVYAAFPWGYGELKNMTGPEDWQKELLADIRDGLKTPDQVIREATASGHGIGKSTLVAWLVLWAISTFEDTRGIVTANTATQLETKTWPEVQKWYNYFIAKDLFVCTATAIYSVEKAHEKNWRIDAIPWNETNPEAFAGLHNQGKRILLVFDEASAIPNIIWEVAEGAMTDANTEIIWAVFGNPTRNVGRFYDCFHKDRRLWRTRRVDSRSVRISNKRQIEEWIQTRGIESDFVKVRVLGEFPSSSEMQFISREIVEAASKRVLKEHEYKNAPVILGVDPAWTGDDALEIYLRQGSFSKHLFTLPKNDDDSYVAGVIARLEDKYNADAVFIDEGYGTGIYSMGKVMGRLWTIVSFAAKPMAPEYQNKRIEMWATMKEWLRDYGAIEDDEQLRDELAAPEAFINPRGKLQLESKESMKKRGEASPNKADALALTFAYPVMPRDAMKIRKLARCNTSYKPF